MKIKKYLSVFLFFLFTNLFLTLGVITTVATPSIFDKTTALYSFEDTLTNSETVEEIKYPEIISAKTVRLYFPDTNEIKEIDLEEYIIGVLIGEMYSDTHVEALKAVAVAARTYTLYMCEVNKNMLYDIVADSNVSQAYVSKEEAVEAWNSLGESKYKTMKKAVESTAGQVVTYDSKPICALYHASSYPNTENSENVFIEALSYLSGKESIETLDTAYRSVVSYTEKELNEILALNSFPTVSFESLKITNVMNSNKRCNCLLFSDSNVGFTIDGRDVRNIFYLNSTSFSVNVTSDTVTFDVYGFGHGVGLSQNGAKIMAENGSSYKEILKTYYVGTEISKTIYN